jgi:hypothetical protein
MSWKGLSLPTIGSEISSSPKNKFIGIYFTTGINNNFKLLNYNIVFWQWWASLKETIKLKEIASYRLDLTAHEKIFIYFIQ